MLSFMKGFKITNNFYQFPSEFIESDRCRRGAFFLYATAKTTNTREQLIPIKTPKYN